MLFDIQDMDPFNRSPLTMSQLVPQPELKASIEAWIAEERSKAAAKKAGTAAMDTA